MVVNVQVDTRIEWRCAAGRPEAVELASLCLASLCGAADRLGHGVPFPRWLVEAVCGSPIANRLRVRNRGAWVDGCQRAGLHLRLLGPLEGGGRPDFVTAARLCMLGRPAGTGLSAPNPGSLYETTSDGHAEATRLSPLPHTSVAERIAWSTTQ